MLSNLDLLILATSAVTYLLIGLALGAYFVVKMGYKKLSSCKDILADFAIKWPRIVYIGINSYFTKREEKLALEKSFRPVEVIVCFRK